MFIYHVQCKVMEPFVGSFATLYIIVEILLVYTYFASHVKQYITLMGLTIRNDVRSRWLSSNKNIAQKENLDRVAK